MDDLFADLVHHTRAAADRHGEHHFTCPECGSESTPRHPKCSFNARGWHCFVCGAGGGLKGLAKRLGLEDNRPYTAPVRPQEARRKPVLRLHDAERMIEEFHAHRASWSAWQAYKPVSRGSFERMRLGLGVLPLSRCKHERLIVPIYSGTEVRGLRGRAIACDCGKWLAPAGTQIGLYPLYNDAALGQGAVVWIVENPVDALLLSERTPYVGVATYSVAYWQDHWTETLRAARPELVVVAYDNDLPGCGGAERRGEMIRDWLKTHPRVPDPAGPKLATRLRAAGLPAALFDWGRAPAKADIGTLLMGGMAA